MNRISKYDVVDVLLVWLCVSAVQQTLVMLFMQAHFILSSVFHGAMLDATMYTLIFFQIGYMIALILLLYLLLAKRRFLITKVFPGSEEKKVVLSDGLLVLTQYSFWLRLLGVITILRNATNVISSIMSEAIHSNMMERQFSLYSPFSHHITGIILGGLIIWKAQWLSDILARVGVEEQPLNVLDHGGECTSQNEDEDEDEDAADGD